MSDPLTLIRELHAQGRAPELNDDGDVVIGDLVYAGDTPTTFMDRKDKPVTLAEAVFAFKHAAAGYGKYLTETKKANIGRVAATDRGSLLSYLKGEVDTVKNIVPYDENSVPQPKRKREREGDDYDAGRPSKRPRLDSSVVELPEAPVEITTTADIRAREQWLSDRVSVLRSTRDFKPVLSILDRVKKREEEEKRKKKEEEAAKNAPTGRYNRYNVNEKQFWKETAGLDTEDFGIDTSGTFNVPGVDFSTLMASSSVPERREEPAEPAAPAPRPSSSSSSRRPKKRKPGATRAKRVPIIIVPSALTSLLTLYNVQNFLEDGEFVTMEEKKAMGVKRQKKVVVVRKKSKDTSARYTVIDNIKELQMEDWDRVVAVFALGPNWQFKNWPFKSPVDLFANVCGFHLKYEDSTVHPNIQSWDVKTISIRKQQRHKDKTAALEFWAHLDQFVARRKLDLNT